MSFSEVLSVENKTQDQKFTIFCVGAIIQREINGVLCILLQERYKGEDSPESGLIEVPCGKVKVCSSAYDVIRQKVYKETGLTITRIFGEERAYQRLMNGYRVLEYFPFCSAQNLEGNYSISMDFFICEAKGEHLDHTSESLNIRWVPIHTIREMLNNRQEKFYPMVIGALQKFCDAN